ncbi:MULTISPECIES: hypothetical protein [unclassified Stenotrophomonas]|uniref:hypothetical protein n=1 Tax=Stenotrophomonas TaxID=40323 RepID=UPI000A434577|nr:MULTISPECIES: hypothetical protein [unclassified Stenotrophomonas]MBH1518254.1 hypothetical protein [Stenotrophomonas maltophilia]MBF9138618.1 hypothetical protein [Stenotrophomonas sp. 232]MBH1578415.1 hypothetical protein [Stenotrophomonas maltophilia]MBH1779247.1 hypothetical protein [Stenotrophomonas maltophilia]MBN4975741.1 hypothetical protein [Stenotrophomonas maltophilia]
MTLSMAWIRSAGAQQELVFCSDSRLRWAGAWDACQKIFPLSRGDCAISFAGDTKFAYPFIHAAINAIELHRGSSRRQIDLFEAKSVLLNAINAMLSELREFCAGQDRFEEPDLRLIFGGYSWKKKRFALWKFHFNNGEREFRSAEISGWDGLGKNRTIVVLGDPNASPSTMRRAARTNESAVEPHEDIEAIAKRSLVDILDSRGLRDASGLNLEPLEVLRNLIRSNSSPYIGGAPQVVKVYQHMNVQPFGIKWPDASGRVAVLGRILPVGEKLHVPVLDPETLKTQRQDGVLFAEPQSEECNIAEG